MMQEMRGPTENGYTVIRMDGGRAREEEDELRIEVVCDAIGVRRGIYGIGEVRIEVVCDTISVREVRLWHWRR